jgi:hypothetical protein
VTYAVTCLNLGNENEILSSVCRQKIKCAGSSRLYSGSIMWNERSCIFGFILLYHMLSIMTCANDDSIRLRSDECELFTAEDSKFISVN